MSTVESRVFHLPDDGYPTVTDDLLAQWQAIVEIMARMARVPSAIITHVALPEIEVLRASTNADNPYKTGDCVLISQHFCEEVVNTRGPVKVVNATTTERWRNAPEIAHGIVSYLGYPISWPNGEVFGTICLLDSKDNAYGEDYEQMLALFRGTVESHLRLLVSQQQMERQNAELQQRLDEITTLRGIIPICCGCKRVRDDEGYWEQVESYVRRHSDAEFSHGLCPECRVRLYPDEC